MNYSLRLQKIPTLVFIGLMALLINLGIWQLNRSQEKQKLVNQREHALTAETINLSTATLDNEEMIRYRRVHAKGHYDMMHQFLIDNQINAGKAGYLVLTPFILENTNRVVLVNRGWIPLGQNRTVLPDLKIGKLDTRITGRINRFPSIGIKLEGVERPGDGWPSVVQVVDSGVLAEKLGIHLFEFQVELDKEQPDGFKREWLTTTLMLPEQHIAYAFQWFALALVLTILFIRYSCKKNDD